MRQFKISPSLCTLLLLLLGQQSIFSLPLQISEFMAVNKTGLKDDDGDRPDWIEIYNPGPARVDLTDWALTDDPTNLFKWRFPKYTILTNEFLIVFASQKDRTNTTNQLHANFKLSGNGGYLGLVDKTTNVVSDFGAGYPAQSDDVSYGRDPISPEIVNYQTKATPGKKNHLGGAGSASPVTFSRENGTFLAPFLLSLSAETTNAIIRYTTNAAFPTPASPIYTQPLLISTSMVVRARAFKEGLLPSLPQTGMFVYMNTNLLGFSSDLPVLVIHSMGSRLNPSLHQFTYLSLFEPRTGRTSLTNRPTFRAIGGLKTRGSSTGGLAKSSWGVEIWDELFEERDDSLLGLPPDSDWVLYAPNNFDPPLIHNPFIHTLSRNSGTYSPRTKFLEVFYVTANAMLATNSYYGVYVLEEKIKRGKDRVPVDKIETYQNLPPEVTGGYLFKIDRTGPGEGGMGAGGNSIILVEPDEVTLKSPQRTPQWNYVKDNFNAFSKALNANATWRDPVLGYAPYIDVDNWIDYHTLEVLSGNVDTLVLSSYFYKPRDGKIMYGPHWDFDRALGSTDGRDQNPRVWTTGPFFSAAWWSRLFTDKDFWQKWVDHWQDLRGGYFANAYVNALVDSLANEVREAQPRDTAKWRNPLRGGGFQGEINLMKAWLSNRMDFIDKQLAQPPILSAAGGRVESGFQLTIATVTNTASVFYTLDGSDPRAPLGELSTNAIEYTGPITIQANTRVTARARDLNRKQSGGPPATTPWSAPRAATFIVQPLPLIISEIMYHPDRGSAAKTNDVESFEFLEIKNTGPAAVALKGVRFTSGVSFDFSGGAVTSIAPGGFVLVVKNLAAFTNRYGAISNIAGEYSGSLENNGERLVLTGPQLETVVDLAYKPEWARTTDGIGFSLVPVKDDPGREGWSSAKSWRASGAYHGSPGRDDSAPATLPSVVINEVAANGTVPGYVELLNTSASSADVSGWFLSDDPAAPRKFAIPAGAILPRGGTLVLQETDLSKGGGFSINGHGGAIYLFSAKPGGELSGAFHSLKHGAMAPAQSYARYLTAAGREVFRPASPTPNTGNSGPLVSPIAITELMYHPAPFRPGLEAYIHEYVEIQNTSGSPAALSDSAGSWRLGGGVQFTFPSGTTLAPRQYALIVSFDPALDLGERGAFLKKYNLPEGTLLFGPYQGQLNNADETVTLSKPIVTGGTTDLLLMDQVSYTRLPPWPANADGTDLSIQRGRNDRFGEDPLNWVSAQPTPAAPNANGDTDGDGLPDWWEIANHLDPFDATGAQGALGDPDRDGVTNLEEYLGGTDPQDSGSYLAITDFNVISSHPQLTFFALPGKSYTILYTDDVKASNWTKLQTVAGPASPAEVSIQDTTANSGAKRFYRLVSP